MKKHYRFAAQGPQTSIRQGDKCGIDMSVGMIERQDGYVPIEAIGGVDTGGGGAAPGAGVEISDDGPMAYTIVDSEGQRHRLTSLPFVTIEFGLREVGRLNKSISVELPASMRPGIDGEGQHAIHGASHHDAARISAVVTEAVDAAIAQQCHAVGRVCQPVYVRYALRMFDGRHAWVSSPVLLLASPLPPAVTVANVADIDEATCRADMHLAYVPVHAIEYRIADTLPRWLMPMVAGIDVYMSLPIATHGSGADGRLTTYGAVAATAPLGAATRFAGHYAALGGDGYADHYLSDADMQRLSWQLSPNVALQDQLLGCTDYYKVATVPFTDIRAMADASPLDIAGFDLASLARRERLSADVATAAYGGGVAVSASGRLYVAPRRKYPRATPTLRSMMAMTSGTAATPVSTVTWLYEEGQCCRLQSGDEAAQPQLSGAFPRYLYVPNAEAYALGLRQGTRRYTLPLRKHPDGVGAYWFGGFGADYVPESATTYSIGDEGADHIEVRGRVAASAPGNPYVFGTEGVSMVTDSVIRALSRVHKTLSQGQMGQFLLYAYADDGVWALGFDAAGKCVLAQLLSSAVCGEGLMCETSTGAAFATDGVLTVLSGTQAERVELPDYATLLDRLPAIRPMSQAMSVDLPDCGALAITSVAYASEANAVVVDAGGVRLVYDLSTRGWTLQSGAGMMLVTSPIVADGDNEAMTLEQAVVRGRFANEAVGLAVYGSRDLHHWHLLATSRRPWVRGLSGTPYVSFRLVVYGCATGTTRIDGVSLSLRARTSVLM